MKNKCIYIIIPLCILVLFFACSGKGDDGSGIKFDKEIYNFGKVNEGEVVRHTFIFKNTGKENILIMSVRPTCGCTVAGEYDEEVKPGESGKIPINLKTGGYEGEISKVIRISTNVPGKEVITLSVRGTVYTPVVVAPKRLWLGQVEKTELFLSGFFTITNNTKTPLIIMEVIAPHENTLAAVKTIKENKIYQVDITVKPPFREGRVSETIIIKTNNPDKEKLYVQYSYDVRAEVFVYPQTLSIEPGPIKQGIEKLVRVESYYVEPISIINPQFIGKTINYSIEELTPGKAFLIKLLLPAGFELAEKEIMVFSFQVKRNETITVYNVPISSEKSDK